MIKKIKDCSLEEIKNASCDVSKVKHILKEGVYLKDNGKLAQMYDSDYFDWLGYGVAFRLVQSDKYRRKRLYDRIKLILSNPNPCFITLTFSNKILEKNSVYSLTKYVKEYLKSQCSQYVANIDYGSKNNRIHFHAVITPIDIIDFKQWHKYGALKLERVRSTNDYKKLARYISKLTLHSLKENGVCQKLIYSR